MKGYKNAFARAKEGGLSLLNLFLIDADTLEEKIERMKEAIINSVRVGEMDAFKNCLDALGWLIEDVHLLPILEKEAERPAQQSPSENDALKLAKQAAADSKARMFMSIQKTVNPRGRNDDALAIIKALTPPIAEHWFVTEDEDLADEILFHLLNTSLRTKKEYDVFLSILREATSSQSLPLDRLTRHYLSLAKERTSKSIHHEMQRILAIALARTKNSILDSENTLLALELKVVRHLENCTSPVFILMEKVAVQLAESVSRIGREDDVKITLHFEDGDRIIQ